MTDDLPRTQGIVRFDYAPYDPLCDQTVRRITARTRPDAPATATAKVPNTPPNPPEIARSILPRTIAAPANLPGPPLQLVELAARRPDQAPEYCRAEIQTPKIRPA